MDRNQQTAIMGEIEQLAISHGVECRIDGGRLQVLEVCTRKHSQFGYYDVRETWIDAPATVAAMRRWLGY